MLGGHPMLQGDLIKMPDHLRYYFYDRITEQYLDLHKPPEKYMKDPFVSLSFNGSF